MSDVKRRESDGRVSYRSPKRSSRNANAAKKSDLLAFIGAAKGAGIILLNLQSLDMLLIQSLTWNFEQECRTVGQDFETHAYNFMHSGKATSKLINTSSVYHFIVAFTHRCQIKIQWRDWWIHWERLFSVKKPNETLFWVTISYFFL